MSRELPNYAFIDASDLYRGTKDLGWNLDYKRFRVFLLDRWDVGVAYLFMGFLQRHAGLYRDLQR